MSLNVRMVVSERAQVLLDRVAELDADPAATDADKLVVLRQLEQATREGWAYALISD
jgi:hypothetical protein